MLVPIEVYNGLNLPYKTIISELEKKYLLLPQNDIKGKFELLISFSTKYLMIKELWDEVFRLYDLDVHIALSGKRQELVKKATYHFYYACPNDMKILHKWSAYYYSMQLSSYSMEEIKHIVCDFNIPLFDLDKALWFYQEHSTYPLGKDVFKKYEKMKELYEKLVLAEHGSLKMWLELLIQVEDLEFICTTINYRLGQNLENKELWKLYINFLKVNNYSQRLVEVYFKYHRYFIDDQELKNEYKLVEGTSGLANVQWLEHNPFDKSVDQTINNVEVYDSNKSLKIKPNFNIFSSQKFSLPFSILDLLKIQSHLPLILHKLHKSCKYFFSRFPYPVYHNFLMGDSIRPPDNVYKYGYFQQSFDCQSKDEVQFEHQFIVSNRFSITSVNNPSVLSQTIKSMAFCFAKFIFLTFQEFTLKEFNWLAKNGTIECLRLYQVTIWKQKNKLAGLEDILCKTPKLQEFDIYYPHLTEVTFQKLSSVTFLKKFQRVALHESTLINPIDFLNFLKTNAQSTTEIFLRFKSDIPPDEQNECNKQITSIAEQTWFENEKPLINVHFFEN